MLGFACVEHSHTFPHIPVRELRTHHTLGVLALPDQQSIGQPRNLHGIPRSGKSPCRFDECRVAGQRNKHSGGSPSLAFISQYADFDRAGLSNFMEYDGPASDIITGFGQVAHTYYNLAGARPDVSDFELSSDAGANKPHTLFAPRPFLQETSSPLATGRIPRRPALTSPTPTRTASGRSRSIPPPQTG